MDLPLLAATIAVNGRMEQLTSGPGIPVMEFEPTDRPVATPSGAVPVGPGRHNGSAEDLGEPGPGQGFGAFEAAGSAGVGRAVGSTPGPASFIGETDSEH